MAVWKYPENTGLEKVEKQSGEDIIIITVLILLTDTRMHTPGQLLINYLATGDAALG